MRRSTALPGRRVERVTQEMTGTLAHNVWWCNQSRYWEDESSAGYIAADMECSRPKYREMVMDAKPADVVVHYRTQRKAIVAVSRVLSVPDKGLVPFKVTIPRQGKRVWFCRADYVIFREPLPKRTFIAQLARFSLLRGTGPFVRRGRVHQAYFMPFCEDGLSVLRDFHVVGWPAWA